MVGNVITLVPLFIVKILFPYLFSLSNLTREYGLTFGKGKKNVNRERLKGKDAAKYRMYALITAALKDCRTWNSLRQILPRKV